ncbi:MAG: DUF368 domain-containing protein [Thermoplasmatota archaeon]
MEIDKFLKRVFEGILMGLANIIPGVSGGTIALILGIYERLISAINTIPLISPILLLQGKGKEFKTKLNEIDFPFLLPLLIGIGSATLVLARFIEFFLDEYTAITFSFFFGLILASAGSLYIRLEDLNYKIVFPVSAGFLFAFFVVGLPTFKTNHSYPMIFISGAIAIVSMILPGISGSFILLSMRQYEYLLNALNTFDIPVLIVFMAGAVTGLFSFSKGLEYLLKDHRSGTLGFLFGLILGALRVPVNEGLSQGPVMIEWIIPAAVGAALVSYLEFYYQN